MRVKTMDTIVLLWLCGALCAVFFELITIGFFFGIAVAAGAIAGAYAAWSGFDGLMQGIIFLGVLVLGILSSQLWINRTQKAKAFQTNFAALIGKHGTVTAPIGGQNTSGLVKVRSETWTAYALDEQSIQVGAPVEVVSVNGCHLIVKEIGHK